MTRWLIVATLCGLSGAAVAQPVVRIRPSNDNSTRAASTAYVDRAFATRAPLVGAHVAMVHQSQGGACLGTGILYANCNIHSSADYLWLETGDQSLYTAVTIAGTPTAGEVVGLNWSIGGTVYRPRYTVPSGATNDSIALGLCSAIVANPAISAALLAYKGADGYGYAPVQTGCANQVFQNHIALDTPWQSAALNGGLTGVSSAHSTVGVASAQDYASPLALDGGPIMQMTRTIPGRNAAAGDLLGYLSWQYSGGGPYMQTGAFANVMRGPAASSLRAVTNTAGGAHIVAEFRDGFDLYGTDQTPCIDATAVGRLTACEVQANAASVTSASTNVTVLSVGNTSAGGATWNIQVPGSSVMGRTGNLELLRSGTGTGLAITPSGGLIQTASNPPASSSSPCAPGQHEWDASYEYRCVATNTWKRALLSTW